MRRVVGAEMGVKAAGGVRDLEGVKAMIAAGATRVGASAGVKIVQQARGEQTPASPRRRVLSRFCRTVSAAGSVSATEHLPELLHSPIQLTVARDGGSNCCVRSGGRDRPMIGTSCECTIRHGSESRGVK